MSDDETAARVRLGSWLSAEPGRTWDDLSRFSTVGCSVQLFPRALGNEDHGVGESVEGHGPTLAAAILAALEAANA